MAGIINLAIVIGIVCLGATYGQIQTTIKRDLNFYCYGVFNFTYARGEGTVSLQDICGYEEFGIDQTFDPALDPSTSTLQVNLTCLEKKTATGDPITAILDVSSDTSYSSTMKEKLKNVLGQMVLDLGPAVDQTDYCALTVGLIDYSQHVSYVSNATEVLLTVPVDRTATLRVEDSMGMTRTMMPPYVRIPISSVESMQMDILGQVTGVYVKHMNLPNVQLMVATFLRYRFYNGEETGSGCNDFGADEDIYPYLNSSDILLNVTTFTGDPNSFTEQQSINLLDTTWTIPDNICGYVELVFMVDPVFTVFPPINRCDYFRVYPISIPCPGHTPGIDHVWAHVPFQCEMTQNAFSPGDVFFSTKSFKHNYMYVTDEVDYHYFEREPRGDKTAWKESTRSGDPSHQLKVRGYAWMNLVYKMFEQQHPNLVTDCSMTNFDVQATIKDLDGIGQQPFVGVQEPEFIINYNDWKDMSYEDIQAHLTIEQMNTVFVNFEFKITHHINIGLLKGILKYMKEMGMPMTDTSGTLMFDEFNFGEDKTIEERVKSIFMQDYANEEELLALVQNASAKMAQLNSKFGIDATCFGKSFDAIIYLVLESHNGYLHSMSIVDLTMPYMDLFDMDSVNEFLQLHGTLSIKNLTRIPMNGCIQRIDRMMQADCADEIAIADLDVDAKTRICIMSRFRDYLKTNIRSLGIPYVVKDVINDRVKEARRGEPGVKFGYPLRVTNGSYNLWEDKWENENHFFNEYEVLPTYTHVCRRKMASCRCETCDHDDSDHMSGDGSDSSGSDSGYSTDGYSDTTTYNPLVKRR